MRSVIRKKRTQKDTSLPSSDRSLPRLQLALLTLLLLLSSSPVPGAFPATRKSDPHHTANSCHDFPSALANRELIHDGFWAESSTNKIQTTSLPRNDTPVWSAAENTIRISMARNEYESFQLAFRPAVDMSEKIIIYQPLGPSKLGTGNFSLYRVEYAGSISPDPLVPMEPDYLGAADPDTGEPEWLSWDMDLVGDTTSAVWVTIYAPPDAQPGIYVSNITFSQSGSEINRRLEITIWDFVLPENPSLGTWFESSSSSYYSYYPFDNLDPEHVEFMKNVYKKFKSHRITPGKLCTIEPWGSDFTVDGEHTVTVDFTRSDPLLEYYLDELNLSRFEFPISGYNPVRWDRDEYDFSQPPYKPSPDYSNVIGQYIKQVADHYRQKGWLDRCVFYYCDEPYAYTRSCNSPHSHPPFSLQRDLNDIIDANAPDLKHLITKTIEPALYGTGEIWDAPHTQYHLNDAAERQELGEECWWYNVGGGISNPGMGLRSLYWHSFNQRVDGVEHWGMNYWSYNTVNNDPWQGSGANGNGYMLYPGSTIGMDDDIIISIRLELTRDGMEDYEYLLKYADLFGRESAEALARTIQPASEFEHDNPMEVSDILLYGVREYIAMAIMGEGDADTSLWLHRLNGTRSGPGPWDGNGSVEHYGLENISDVEGLSKTWYGDGSYELAMKEEAAPLHSGDDAGGWFPNNQPSLNSSITVETSPEKHIEGTGALNLSFWRNGGNVSQLYNCRVQRNSFSISNWSDYDLFEFDCMPEGVSLNNFYVELGFQSGSWYDRIGRHTRTGMLPGRWHHIIIDVSQLDRGSFDHIQIFIHNRQMEIPFHHYSLLIDNITLRSAERTLSGNVTFDAIDLGPVPAANWQIEVLGDWPLHEECSVTVRVSSSDDGSSWGEWRSIFRDNDTIFGFAGSFTPRRYVRIEASILGTEADGTRSPCISEVRMWNTPLKYADIGISPDGFQVVPELPAAGEEIGFEMEIHNAGETEIGPVFVSISSEHGGVISSISNHSVFLVPGKTAITVDNVALAAGDHMVTVALHLPPGVIDTNMLNNSITAYVHVNAPPVPIISAPRIAESHKEIVFDGNGSLDPDGEIIAYRWDMGDGTILEGATVSHIYTQRKDFEVSLTVTDDSGFNVSATKTISIGIPIPTADIIHVPERGNVTTDYILSAVIFDPLGAVDEYTWRLPGGQERKGSVIDWRFRDDGIMNVSLTIEFGYEPYNISTWKHILVENLPPVAAASANRTEAAPGNEITFTSYGTSDPDDEPEILLYHWDFGDGKDSSKATVRHSYNRSGKYIVNLTVTDDDGGANRTALKIYVHTDPPVADFIVPDVFVNETASFDGSLAEDPDGQIVNYTWNLKAYGESDTLTFYGKDFDHVFDRPGDYTLNLTVRDNNGDTGTREKSFKVYSQDVDGDGIEDSNDPEIDGDGGSSSALTVLIVGITVIICIAGVILLIRKRRKRSREAAPEAHEEIDEGMKDVEKEREQKKMYEELYGGLEKEEEEADVDYDAEGMEDDEVKKEVDAEVKKEVDTEVKKEVDTEVKKEPKVDGRAKSKAKMKRMRARRKRKKAMRDRMRVQKKMEGRKVEGGEFKEKYEEWGAEEDLIEEIERSEEGKIFDEWEETVGGEEEIEERSAEKEIIEEWGEAVEVEEEIEDWGVEVGIIEEWDEAVEVEEEIEDWGVEEDIIEDWEEAVGIEEEPEDWEVEEDIIEDWEEAMGIEEEHEDWEVEEDIIGDREVEFEIIEGDGDKVTDREETDEGGVEFEIIGDGVGTAGGPDETGDWDVEFEIIEDEAVTMTGEGIEDREVEFEIIESEEEPGETRKEIEDWNVE